MSRLFNKSSLNPAHRQTKTGGGYLFLPKPMTRGAFLKWLRRTHAWIGLWGAALGLLFGGTGILLNHREVMKISAAHQAQTEIQLPLLDFHPADPKALAVWLGQTLKLDTQHAKIRQEKSKIVMWNNAELKQPPLWQITLNNPQRRMQAEYWAGNAFVTVKQSEGNLFALLSNLHKGSGMGMAWVLLADSLAGGLIVLSITGILLWTRLHGPRLTAIGLGLSSLSLIVAFTLAAITET